jgi:hypothetical protein
VSLVWAMVGQTLDATSMALMVATLGITSETNPIVQSWGAGPALLLKAALMVFLVLASRLWGPSVRRPVLMLACGAGLVGAITNIWTLS